VSVNVFVIPVPPAEPNSFLPLTWQEVAVYEFAAEVIEMPTLAEGVNEPPPIEVVVVMLCAANADVEKQSTARIVITFFIKDLLMRRMSV
jgi:hypothetical protein